MATVAYNDNWYDTTIKFIKASRDLYQTQGQDFADPKDFTKFLDGMTKRIGKLQNEMFSKKKARVGVGKPRVQFGG